MVKPTKTTNPLHFEDLEPHRFEDLIRQLVYDFREWQSLEATGRKGGDEGFDARGWEVRPRPDEESDGDDETEHLTLTREQDRIWLIQCKREKSVTPKKLVGYLNQIKLTQGEALYGLIFAAACDFSKSARDRFREWCVSHHIQEGYLWGRAEVEDVLFQPKNDHLLFAYFGVSLQIRKRSSKTRIRSILSMKRQAVRLLGPISHHHREHVLIRDAETVDYPYSQAIENFDERPEWRVYFFVRHYHAGLEFLIRTHHAYVEDDGKSWDYEDRVRLDQPFNNPWATRKNDPTLEKKAWHYWKKLPDEKRGTLEVIGLIPYEDVLAIDEHGDEYFEEPHVYVNFRDFTGPFSGGIYWKISTGTGTVYYVSPDENRIDQFPTEYPAVDEKDVGDVDGPTF